MEQEKWDKISKLTVNILIVVGLLVGMCVLTYIILSSGSDEPEPKVIDKSPNVEQPIQETTTTTDPVKHLSDWFLVKSPYGDDIYIKKIFVNGQFCQMAYNRPWEQQGGSVSIDCETPT